jgi:transcriptional antiterminator NusG
MAESAWYVIQVMSGQENRVLARLNTKREANRAAGIDDGVEEIQIPVDRVETRRKSDSKVVVKERKRFPGYILIKASLYDEQGERKAETWDLVRNTDGVIGFIGGASPARLSEADVANMMKMEAEGATPKPRIQYKIGETVQLKGSAFVGYEGVIESIDNERQRLKVSVNIFGRATPVEIGIDEVERPQ